VSLLGGFNAYLDVQSLAFPTKKARSLFAYLLTHRDRAHSRELLAGLFWDDLPLYYVTGSRDAALKQYRECYHLLREELGIQPLPETEALIERIKAGLVPGGVAYVAAFSTEDPGYRRCRERGLPEVEPNTFFSAKRGMHLFYLTKGELKDFFKDFELLSYAEGYSLDLAHGDPHHHGWTGVLAKKPRWKHA